MGWRSKVNSVACNNERSVMAHLTCVNVDHGAGRAMVRRTSKSIIFGLYGHGMQAD
jgi:hypothetical protein